jgi:mannan endo-1,4-beta-mannosidase
MTRVAAVVATLLAAALAACGTIAIRDSTASLRGVVGPAGAASHAARYLPTTGVGVVSNNLAVFDARCDCRPNIAVHYVKWNEDPAVSQRLAVGMISDAASPLLELSPYGTTLSAISSGRDDRWLRAYAIMVRELNSEVLLSFAPESNGYWYTWGWPNVKPSAEVAAWRHVVTIFREEDVVDAKWVWIVNQLWARSGPLNQLWPGASWVDEVGIDGYFKLATDTFTSVFGPTISAVTKFAPRTPVLVSETGAAPQAGKPRAVQQLVAGVARYHLTGFVWFDIDQSGQHGLGKADWSLDDDPAALAAYASAVSAVTAKKTPGPTPSPSTSASA